MPWATRGGRLPIETSITDYVGDEADIHLPGQRIRDTTRSCAEPGRLASVVRQTDGALSRVALARMTFARMSDAFLVQMNGFGFSLW